METGRVDVPDLPDDDASAETKDQVLIALLVDIEKEVSELEGRLDSEPREVLKQAWVLHTIVEANPARWLQNFAKRRERNGLISRLESLRDQSSNALEEDEGKQVWEDLPYTRHTLGLLFDKIKATGEVKRLILSPLGKLQFAKIKYQRDSPEDLARVCQDIGQIVRDTSGLDDETKAWGAQNREALLLSKPPTSTPPGRVSSATPGLALLLIGLLGLGGGGALLGKAIPALVDKVPPAGVFGALGVGALLFIIGAVLLNKVRKQKAQVPKDFANLSVRFRERLYLVCALRNLYRSSSRLTVTNEAFRSYLNDNGGKGRWRRVKFEGRDLTELFVEEEWDPRGTVETWLNDKVTKVFRLESTSLSPPEDQDEDTWEVVLKAYLLESIDQGGSDAESGKLLAAVGDLLFTKRGEDVNAERDRVFEEVREAWNTAQREGHSL